MGVRISWLRLARNSPVTRAAACSQALETAQLYSAVQAELAERRKAEAEREQAYRDLVLAKDGELGD